MDGGREEASGGGISRARKGGSKGARERNFRGGIGLRRALASIHIHKPSHNAALAIDTLLLQMKNSEQVSVYCLSGGCHDFMSWQLWHGCI